MSAPPRSVPAPLPSLSSSGFADGLGRRVLAFDREEGVMLERLLLRPELAAFEPLLRERLERIASLEDERIARPRTIERTADGGLVVASEFVPGIRLSDLLHAAADQGTAPGLDAAFGFLLDVLPAFCGLHAGAGVAHGTMAPCRIVITPGGQIVLLDALYGGPLSLLRYSRARLWSDFGIAAPSTAGAPRLNVQTDITQAGLVAVMLALGRPLGDHEYPDGLIGVLAEVSDVAQIRGDGAFAAGVALFFERALHLGGHQPYDSADDALIAVRELAGVLGVPVCRRALLEVAEGFSSQGSEPGEGLEPWDDDSLAQAGAEPLDVVEEFSYEVITNVDPYALADAAPAGDGDQDLESGVDAEVDLSSLTDEPETRADPPADLTEPKRVLHADPLHDDTPGRAELFIPTHQEVQTPALVSEPGEGPQGHPAVTAPPQPAPPITASPSPELEGPPGQPAGAAPALRQRRAKRSRSARARKDKLRSVASIDAPLLTGPLPTRPPEPAPRPEPSRPASGPWLVAPARAAAFEPPVPEGTQTLVHAPSGAPVRMPTYSPPPLPVYAAPAGAIAPPVPAAYAPPIPWSPPAAPAPPVTPIAQHPAAPVPLRLKEPTPRPRVVQVQPVIDIYAAAPSLPVRERRRFPWRLAGVMSAVIVGGALAGRAHLVPSAGDVLSGSSGAVSAAPSTDVAVPVSVPANTGIVQIETQPAGARVLLDGRPAGESPVTLDRVPAGRHTFTFVSAAGSVTRTVRVEGGRTLKLDVPIFSGWVGIFAPIVLDVAIGRQTIGTTEEPRLMLSPGRHELTLTNRALGYRSVQSVDIEPGEVRTITLDPRGTANLNAQPWAEVWVDGQKVGDTPLANLKLPLGTREVLFRHPQLGERRATVTVKGNAPVALSVDMNQPGE